ncbi:uncharacterized protein LOC135836141 [Planococcus citri]|uniref:uncharacterized protein LOC135836141 n=1 Tax=Planococcus citri TaxID=170843 RepID=UPI0031F7C4F5
MSTSDDNSIHTDDGQSSLKKKNKKGIVYLSTLPINMNVTKLREIMENFGQVGRIYLQPQFNKKKEKKPAKQFSEGWVEFEKKRVAKEVARGLNNKKIESRKKSRLYDYIWNIKYLSKFKWVHLSERVAYERAVRKQRMRMEISQAKREAADFASKVDLSNKIKAKSKKEDSQITFKLPSKLPAQKHTEEYYVEKRKKKGLKDRQDDGIELLKSLFS